MASAAERYQQKYGARLQDRQRALVESGNGPEQQARREVSRQRISRLAIEAAKKLDEAQVAPDMILVHETDVPRVVGRSIFKHTEKKKEWEPLDRTIARENENLKEGQQIKPVAHGWEIGSTHLGRTFGPDTGTTRSLTLLHENIYVTPEGLQRATVDYGRAVGRSAVKLTMDDLVGVNPSKIPHTEVQPLPLATDPHDDLSQYEAGIRQLLDKHGIPLDPPTQELPPQS